MRRKSNKPALPAMSKTWPIKESMASKFWMREIRVPEKACSKVDPSNFIRTYISPFMHELAIAITTARRIGKEFKLTAYMSYPSISAADQEKKEEPRAETK